ncbi:MAG TPA: hypothetical protein VNE39_12895 [Planctomycetota bacterium]|nr:hypothetical protein [Planctomycetota bacterium]
MNIILKPGTTFECTPKLCYLVRLMMAITASLISALADEVGLALEKIE